MIFFGEGCQNGRLCCPYCISIVAVNTAAKLCSGILRDTTDMRIKGRSKSEFAKEKRRNRTISMQQIFDSKYSFSYSRSLPRF